MSFFSALPRKLSAAVLCILGVAARSRRRSPRKRPRVVAIEGTIAVGKSTLGVALRDAGWVVCTEGADDPARWQGALTWFYTDPPRWSFLLQVSILEDMRRLYDRIMDRHRGADVVFVERSPLSAYIFVDNSCRAGHLTPLERRTYDRLHTQIGWEPDVIISLECPIEATIQRLKARSRDAEKDIDENYLRTMDKCYRERVAQWKVAVRSGALGVQRVISVDASLPPNEVLAAVNAHIGKL